jgi:hypothetical protein
MPVAVRGNYRSAGARLQNEEKAKNSSRSKNKFWSYRLKLSERPIRLHFDRPERLYKDVDSDTMLPWKRVRRHYLPGFGKGKFGIYVECALDRCLTCAHGDPLRYGFGNMEANALLSKCEAGVYNALSGWIEEWYHLVDKPKDKKGDKGETLTYISREPCMGKSCEHCQKKRRKVFGQRFFNAFSEAQWRALMNEVYEKVERTCQCKDAAGEHGYLYPIAYVCSNPGCGEGGTVLVDVMMSCPQCGDAAEGGFEILPNPERHSAVCQKCSTEWSLLESEDAELAQRVNELVKCPECGQSDYPKPVYYCTTEGCAGEPHDIYDCQITLKREGEGKQSKLIVLGWKIQEPDRRLFDPKLQGEGEGADAVVKRHHEHLNLDDIYAPDVPAAQAEMLGLTNLFKDANTRETKQYRPRGEKTPEQEEAAAPDDDVESDDAESDEAA